MRSGWLRLSHSIFWLVLPSLPLFLLLPAMLRLGWNFWLSLSAACAVTALIYAAMVWPLRRAVVAPAYPAAGMQPPAAEREPGTGRLLCAW